MGRTGRWIAGSLAVVAGAAGCLIVYLAYVFDPCDVAIRRWTRSPDGSLLVVVFEKECGATVAFNTQVSLAPANTAFRPNKSPPFLILPGKHADDIVLHRSAAKTLEVTLPQGEQVFRREARVDAIAIESR